MGKVAAEDAVELEGMRKHDSSWYPCQVSLSWDARLGSSLIVDFGSEEYKDVIFTKEDVLERLRFRSTPLQGDDCLGVKEGDHVLASENRLSGNYFFDAEVEKVFRVRHSKRALCRCTFEIKWLRPDHKGGPMNVSTSIMKLAINNIDTHPIVGEFLKSVGSGAFSLFEDPFETDLTRLLEKQIEEIGKLADVTKKGCMEDILLEVKTVDLAENPQHKMVSSRVSLGRDQASPDQNNSRRTTRKQNKKQVEVPNKNPPPSQPILEEPNRLHLSPLGARAALASLMYKLPRREDLTTAFQSSLEKDADKITEEDFFPTPVPKHAKTKILRNSDKRDASNEVLQIRASSRMQNRLEKPACVPQEKEAAGSSVTFNTSSKGSVSAQKLNHPMKTTRSARSTIQNGIGHSNNYVERESSHEKMEITPSFIARAHQKLNHPKKTTRSTRRSATRKGNGHSSDEVEKNSLLEEVDPKSSLNEVEIEMESSSDERKMMSLSYITRVSRKLSHPIKAARFTRSVSQERNGHSNNEVEQNSLLEQAEQKSSVELKFSRDEVGMKSSSDETKLMSPANIRRENRKLNNSMKSTRSTRSANQKGIGHSIEETEAKSLFEDVEQKSSLDEVETKPSHDETKLMSPTCTSRFHVSVKVNEQLEESYANKNLITPEMKATRRKKPLPSPLDAEANIPQANKRPKASIDARLTRRSAGEISGDDILEDGKKKSVSSKKMPKQRLPSGARRSQKH